MPRHAVPELFQEAIEAADPRYQAETALFELAMVLERPDARWERLSAEQSAFYNDLCFDFDESGQLRVKYDPQVVA
jgi:hypothetical protein